MSRMHRRLTIEFSSLSHMLRHPGTCSRSCPRRNAASVAKACRPCVFPLRSASAGPRSSSTTGSWAQSGTSLSSRPATTAASPPFTRLGSRACSSSAPRAAASALLSSPLVPPPSPFATSGPPPEAPGAPLMRRARAEKTRDMLSAPCGRETSFWSGSAASGESSSLEAIIPTSRVTSTGSEGRRSTFAAAEGQARRPARASAASESPSARWPARPSPVPTRPLLISATTSSSICWSVASTSLNCGLPRSTKSAN
mmetsp:Transcript_23852/g.37307  ORF Transcript_23852/g.37307 Transcript_23852/m.37307 type:complete len:255 (+) Transcript_23852:936-1700(+)